MSLFEEAVKSLPYSTDWWKMRCSVAELMQAVIWSDHCSVYKQYKIVHEDEGNYSYFLLFQYDEELYLWLDYYVGDLPDGSQLERIINKYMSKIIYSSHANSSPIGAMFFQMVEKNIAKETVVEFPV